MDANQHSDPNPEQNLERSTVEKLKYPEFLDLLHKRLERAQKAVDEEYIESDRRLNWMLLFHAFLFGAFATTVQALTSAPRESGTDELHLARLLLTLFSVVGIATAFCTAVATVAALVAIGKTKAVRGKIEDSAALHGLTPSLFGERSALHFLGLLPTILAPWMLLFAWTAICWYSLTTSVAAYR